MTALRARRTELLAGAAMKDTNQRLKQSGYYKKKLAAKTQEQRDQEAADKRAKRWRPPM